MNEVIVNGQRYYQVYNLEPGKKYIIQGVYDGWYIEQKYWTFNRTGIFVKYSGDNVLFRSNYSQLTYVYDADYHEFYRHVSYDISDMLNILGASGKTLKMELMEKARNFLCE